MSHATLSSKELAQNLLTKEHTESEVAELIHDQVEKNSDTEWVPLGREPNNYSIVENQQADAMAAFTELVVNSIDAIILRNYFQRFENDHNGSEFDSLKEAAEELVNEDEDDIEIAATGERNGPFSLTLYDNGCGQPQNEFEHTFLNVLSPGELKQEYDFLQGKYGMGSTGVLPFCGDKGYKFIASASYETPSEWSWSIIRKNRDETRYEYLIVDGRPPTFSGEFGGNEQGTFIKCYEYQSETKSNITKRFRYRLERYIAESPVPIQLHEKRTDGYGSPYTQGLLPSLENRQELVQDIDRIEHDFDNDVLGEQTIEIFLMMADDLIEEKGLSKSAKEAFVTGAKQTEQAILFTYNGQTHGDQGQTFLRRRCKFRRISNDTLVHIDFSDVDDADVVDLFKPSRDRLQHKEPAEVLKNELEDVLSENEMLREEEQRRRTKDIKEETNELEENVLEQILKKKPSLKGYLKKGEKSPTIDNDGDEKMNYDGRFYPTQFNIIEKYRSRADYDIWEENRVHIKRIPKNKTSLQRFELDAKNDYLDRNKDQGNINTSLPAVIKSKRLKNGILSLRLDPPETLDQGDSFTLETEISPTQAADGTLSETFKIEIIDSVERDSITKEKKEDPPAQGFDLPDTQWVSEDEWDNHGFDEHSIVRLEPIVDDSMMLWINEDAAPLVNFRRRHNLKQSGKKHIKQTYKLGIILHSVGQYMELEKEYSDDPMWEEIDPADVVETSIKGVAQSLLEQTISDDRLNELTY